MCGGSSLTVATAHRRSNNERRCKKFGCLIGAGLIHIPGSLCTTTTSSPPRVSRGAPEAVLAAFGRRYMQDPGCELLRIFLPRTRVNKREMAAEGGRGARSVWRGPGQGNLGSPIEKE